MRACAVKLNKSRMNPRQIEARDQRRRTFSMINNHHAIVVANAFGAVQQQSLRDSLVALDAEMASFRVHHGTLLRYCSEDNRAVQIEHGEATERMYQRVTQAYRRRIEQLKREEAMDNMDYEPLVQPSGQPHPVAPNGRPDEPQGPNEQLEEPQQPNEQQLVQPQGAEPMEQQEAQPPRVEPERQAGVPPVAQIPGQRANEHGNVEFPPGRPEHNAPRLQQRPMVQNAPRHPEHDGAGGLRQRIGPYPAPQANNGERQPHDLRGRLERGARRVQRIPRGERFPRMNRLRVLVCNFCGAEHPMFACESFLRLTLSQRDHEVEQLALCRNCLMPKQREGRMHRCRAKACRRCGALHNSVLCRFGYY